MTALILLSVVAAFAVPSSLEILPPLIGIGGYLSLAIIRKKLAPIDAMLGGCLSLIALLITLSESWGIAPHISAEKILHLDLLILGTIPLLAIIPMLHPIDMRVIRKILPVITGIVGIGIIAELYLGIPLAQSLAKLSSRNSTPASLGTIETLFLLLLPVSLYATTKSGHLTIGALLVLLTGLLLWQVDSETLRFSGLCGLAAPVILFLFPKSALSAPVLLTGFILAFLPFISPLMFDVDVYVDTTSQSLDQSSPATAIGKNLEIYDFVSRKIVENPMTGFGIESSGTINFDSEQKYYQGTTIAFPHNMALQVWLEFGIIGVISFGSLLLGLYNRLNRTHGTQRTLAYSTFCTGLMILMFSWSIWSEWLIGALILSACLLPLAKGQSRAPSTS